jgi:hypothetical protein
MGEPTDHNVPVHSPRRRLFRLVLYVFYVCVGVAAGVRMSQGDQTALGFWAGLFFVLVGIVSALALMYAAVTRRVP